MHVFISSELGWMNVSIGVGNRGCSGFPNGPKALINAVFLGLGKH